MTPVLRSLAVSLLLVSAAPAAGSASFANRSIGLEVGAFKFFGDGDLVDFGVPISLTGSFYIDSSFVFFLHGSVNVFNQRAFVGPRGEGGIVLGGGGQLGLRYLFLEESIRPYVDLYVAVLGIGRPDQREATSQPPKFFLGPGAGGGVDFFITDSISAGPRVFFDLFITLNATPRYALGGAITASTYW